MSEFKREGRSELKLIISPRDANELLQSGIALNSSYVISQNVNFDNQKFQRENQELKQKLREKEKHLCAPHRGAVSMNEACGGCDGCIEMQRDWAMNNTIEENQKLKRKLGLAVDRLDEMATDGSILGNNEDHENLRLMAVKALKEIKGEK